MQQQHWAKQEQLQQQRQQQKRSEQCVPQQLPGGSQTLCECITQDTAQQLQ
jgi:hypothetical protein